MFDKIYQHYWISLDKEIRERLTKVFDIPTSGVSEIFDQTVVSDGKTNNDLSVITLDKLKEYVKQEGEFSDLWKLTLWKARFQVDSFKKQAEGGQIVVKEEVKEPVKEEVVSQETKTDVLDRYCDTCDAKRGRHKKVCPKFK